MLKDHASAGSLAIRLYSPRFVNTAIENTSEDKDIATLKQAQQRVRHVNSLRQGENNWGSGFF